VRAAREGFGSRLRAARERAGIGLDAIAQSTKINRSLLADLENNDLSRWPGGIFRRAFFREYLAAIDYSSEALEAEFARLFPDAGAPLAEESSAELRLTLAPMPSSTTRRLMMQTAAALADGLAVALLTAAAVALLPFQPWAVVAVLTLAYYVVSAALLGRAPVAAWLARDRTIARRNETESTKALPTEPALLRIVVRHTDVPRERPVPAIGADAALEPPAPVSSSRRHAASH
jgi:transcriptional regulator with XRE-family HTH domain